MLPARAYRNPVVLPLAIFSPWCAETPVVAMELVEVAPGWDPGYMTALNGLRIIQEAITGMAIRRLGIKETHYLDPRTSGQDPVPGQRND